jgi:hypothetical protein
MVAGWNGTGTQNVTVTMDTSNLSITGATLINGFPSAPTASSGKTVVFSLDDRRAATVTLTSATRQAAFPSRARPDSWPVAAGLTDIAGNLGHRDLPETGGGRAQEMRRLFRRLEVLAVVVVAICLAVLRAASSLPGQLQLASGPGRIAHALGRREGAPFCRSVGCDRRLGDGRDALGNTSTLDGDLSLATSTRRHTRQRRR